MKQYPNLRGRYDSSVFSPLQWGLLAVIGFVFLMAFQIDQLRAASFKIELFDQEVLRVEHAARQTPASRTMETYLLRPTLIVSLQDWPTPPIPTKWSPKPKKTEAVIDIE